MLQPENRQFPSLESATIVSVIKETAMRLSEELTPCVTNGATEWSAFNHIATRFPLRNRYHMIRHGRSEANEGAIYSGDAILGRARYSLVPQGERQVLDSIDAAMMAGVLDDQTIIVASSFLRVRQTAHLSARLLGISEIFLDDRLGERGVGALEGQGMTREEKSRLDSDLSIKDQADCFNQIMGRESTVSVLNRFTGLIAELEASHTGKHFLLVSHHDSIQIVRTALLGFSPGEYFRVGKLQNAEIVELNK